jgi:malate synthase
MSVARMGSDIELIGRVRPEHREIVSPDALAFVAKLHRRFNLRRSNLLKRRVEVQNAIDRGAMPDFMEETAPLREAAWIVAPVAAELRDRRVEITSPVDRKMMINALNSGAQVFMADFEDSHSPTWEGTLQGQLNLVDAVRRRITYSSDDGKVYALNQKVAVLFVRPRGWHLNERHMLVDREEVSASLFDFGLYFFHNAKELFTRSSAPYFYLPKLENHLEARLWNDVFHFAQNELQIPQSTIKATVLIETLLAAFQMHEILFELKDHSAGLNCGRWDYIFSVIKKFRRRSDFVLPDRELVTMESPFLKSYALLAIQTAHRRGTHAIGGMAAQIPIKDDPAADNLARMKVLQDKLREVSMGHDGTWVAHPGLVKLAREAFDRVMSGPNQIRIQREDVDVRASDLLTVPYGEVSKSGFRNNVVVSLLYMEAWLRGQGAVAINHLMEDAATAEISRAQLWQCIRYRKEFSPHFFKRVLDEELENSLASLGSEANADLRAEKLKQARDIIFESVMNDKMDEFITLEAYRHLEETDTEPRVVSENPSGLTRGWAKRLLHIGGASYGSR